MNTQHKIKLIECPRDAMQGWQDFIPTEKKVDYINALLQVGFDTLDFGSFVSPKAIPQMADTREVLKKITTNNTKTKLLAIIANTRGAEEALLFDQINYLGFPFSVSETFQQRNANSSIEQSFDQLKSIQELCVKNNKQLVVYLSMAFGNPYGDKYDEGLVFSWAEKLSALGITILSIADTVGLATSHQVGRVTKHLIESLPQVEIGVHLHSTVRYWKEKVDAALHAGCIRFDGALKGIGGCPMAGNDLVGNMNTELMLSYFQELGRMNNINEDALENSLIMASEIFA